MAPVWAGWVTAAWWVRVTRLSRRRKVVGLARLESDHRLVLEILRLPLEKNEDLVFMSNGFKS